jgi:hypothetical protein
VNYLSLVQKMLLLTRASDARISEPLANFDGASGITYEAIQWIADADTDIQRLRDGWRFMRMHADIALASGERSVTPSSALDTISKVIPAEDSGGQRSIGCYLESLADESRVAYLDYEHWYGNGVGRGAQTRTGRPGRCTIDQGSIMFDTTADQNYQLTFDYVRTAQRMTTVTSESLIPTEHRMAIVWWALLHFYCLTRDKTTEFREKCRLELAREMTRLYNKQLPPITTG